MNHMGDNGYVPDFFHCFLNWGAKVQIILEFQQLRISPARTTDITCNNKG